MRIRPVKSKSLSTELYDAQLVSDQRYQGESSLSAYNKVIKYWKDYVFVRQLASLGSVLSGPFVNEACTCEVACEMWMPAVGDAVIAFTFALQLTCHHQLTLCTDSTVLSQLRHELIYVKTRRHIRWQSLTLHARSIANLLRCIHTSSATVRAQVPASQA
jgi:hypothetical protein